MEIINEADYTIVKLMCNYKDDENTIHILKEFISQQPAIDSGLLTDNNWKEENQTC